MKQIELIRFGENALKQENIQDAGIKARMLLQHILNQTRQEIIINSEKIVNQNQIDEYEKSINKIIQQTIIIFPLGTAGKLKRSNLKQLDLNIS